MLQKCDDPYLALLSYRATPLQNGYSPAELLMNRHLRTLVPQMDSQLRPTVPDQRILREKEEQLKQAQKVNFDQRHRSRDLKALSPRQTVWVREKDGVVPGEVMWSAATPRSYVVETPLIGELRRNRWHLVPRPPVSPSIKVQDHRARAREPSQLSAKPDESVPLPADGANTPVNVTRYGRKSVPPKNLDL